MTFQARQSELLPRSKANKLLLVVCSLSLCGILIAGLSPFTPHLRNQVGWLGHQNGLFFGEYGSILSSAPLRMDGPPDGPCSVELWLRPALLDDSNTILAFQTPETPLEFRIQQNGHALIFTRQVIGPNHQAVEKLIYMNEVFRSDGLLLITITAGAQGTTVYLNGAPTRTAADFGLTRHDLNGGIVVGDSPVINDSWSGVLGGIGIYNQELAADQVRRNYEDWTHSGKPRGLEKQEAVAVYPFTERSGKVIHNQVASGVDLEIPDYYLVLYPSFLRPFWQNWGWNWAFWKDGLVNVAGFMPLGVFFCAYFSLSRPISRAIVLTIIFGCVVSFAIEATQFYLPTRDSESIDFINNTLGTGLGALLYGTGFVKGLLARFGVVALEDSGARRVPDDALLKAS